MTNYISAKKQCYFSIYLVYENNDTYIAEIFLILLKYPGKIFFTIFSLYYALITIEIL